MSPSVEPFNEAKYKALMDGLECTEVRYKELLIDNEKYRIDSEFYSKKYLKAYKKIKSISHGQISDLYKTLTDFHANGSYETIATYFELLDEPDYAYMVRTTDLEKENYTESVKYVTKQAYEFLAKSKVFGGELLINKIGSPGRTYLMPNLNMPVSLGMNLFLLKFKENKNISEEVAYLFFNTNFGKHIIERKINGTVPLTIDKQAIKSLYLPLFSENFIKYLKLLIKKKEDLLKYSKELYTLATGKLDEAIGIKMREETLPLYSTKSLNSSYKTSGRLDAEYYDLRYDHIESQVVGNNTVKNSCVIYDSNYAPVDNVEYKYIELANIDNSGGISNVEVLLGATLPSRARRLVKAGQVIVSSVEGSLSSCALITHEYDNAICSTGFYVVSSNKYNSETLLLLFKSEAVQAMLKKRCSGTILTAISKDEFEKMPLPEVEDSIQKDIAAIIQESFSLRDDSKKLLDLAVKTVEMAIESDEESALLWLESQK